MQIKQISVNGLFGIFDHVIPLNMDERITIIHSPNGYGKTAMLRILSGIFNSKYSMLFKTLFSTFRVEFDDKSIFTVSKENDGLNSNITIGFQEVSSQPLVFKIYYERIPDHLNAYSEEYQIYQTFEGQSFKIKREFPDEPDWFHQLKSKTNIHLIESQRLLNITSTKDEHSIVSIYSAELAQIMQNKFTEYGISAQSLDRTLPVRLFKEQSLSRSTYEHLRKRLDDLEVTRSSLIEVGLLDKDTDTDFQIQSENILDDGSRNFLSIYLDDMEAKFSVFHDTEKKIHLLRKIINHKFLHSYKEISFDKRKGFTFKSLYDHNKSNTTTILSRDLSSGEQHELILLYELLFKVQPNSLVLIDEPELSLHVGWQIEFLKDLQKIIKLTDVGILIATHAPSIIEDRWDLTVELKRPE
jgi:ABC-type transport system involved in cytochrome c biogenesis ATPase subunit